MRRSCCWFWLEPAALLDDLLQLLSVFYFIFPNSKCEFLKSTPEASVMLVKTLLFLLWQTWATHSVHEESLLCWMSRGSRCGGITSSDAWTTLCLKAEVVFSTQVWIRAAVYCVAEHRACMLRKPFPGYKDLETWSTVAGNRSSVSVNVEADGGEMRGANRCCSLVSGRQRGTQRQASVAMVTASHRFAWHFLSLEDSPNVCVGVCVFTPTWVQTSWIQHSFSYRTRQQQ